MSGKIDIDSLSKKELQRILSSKGESKAGNKATLVDRLRTSLERERDDGDSDDDDDDGADYDDGTGYDDDDDVTSPKTRFEKEAALRQRQHDVAQKARREQEKIQRDLQRLRMQSRQDVYRRPDPFSRQQRWFDSDDCASPGYRPLASVSLSIIKTVQRYFARSL